MATEPSPPDPEQIVPPTPVSRALMAAMAAGAVIALVLVVVILRWTFAPQSPTDLASLPSLGPADAPLTIFEYANFACERCAKVRPIVKEVLARYEGRVRLVYISFPQGQASATRAAMAGVCAKEQNKFWEFADLMFERQPSWVQDPDPMSLWTVYAGQVGMDTNRFVQCMGSSRTEKAVSQQLVMAVGQVIQATPTFIIGQRPLVNPRSLDDFVTLIDKELAGLESRASK